MKKLFLFTALLMTIAVLAACNKTSTNSPDTDKDGDPDEAVEVAEFSALELDFSTLETGDEPKDTPKSNDKWVERFGTHLEHMNRFITRINNYVDRFPNDEAQLLIEQAELSLIAAITAYEAEEYREAFTLAKRTRTLLREAITILRPNGSKGAKGQKGNKGSKGNKGK